jgi:hypothetical protein
MERQFSRAWLAFPPHRVARYEKRGRGDYKIDLWWRSVRKGYLLLRLPRHTADHS